MFNPSFASSSVTLLLCALLVDCCGGDSNHSPADADTEGDADSTADADTDTSLDGATDAESDGGEGPVISITFNESSRATVADLVGHLAFPDVARLANGSLILVFRQGASHVDSSGKIMMQIGDADGQTWTDPTVLLDEPGIDERDPSVTVLPSGEVLVTYFQYRQVPLEGTTLSLHQIFVASSTDNGATFSEPYEQISVGTMDETGASLTEGHWVDGDGAPIMVHASSSPALVTESALYLASYGGEALNIGDLAGAPRSRISLGSRSLAGGDWTWELVLPDVDPTVWVQEPALLELQNGAWLMQIRTADGTSPGSAGNLRQARSDDEGETWTDWEPLGLIGHAPYLLQLENGVLLSAYREINATFTNEWVSLMYSLDDGASWSEPIRIEDCGAAECGYPSLLELDDDKLLVLYYTAGGETIDAVIYDFEVDRDA